MTEQKESISFEAAPDIEVVLTIMRPKPGFRADNNTVLSKSCYDITENEANINISRTIFELKQSLGKLLEVSPTNLRIFKVIKGTNEIEMLDDRQIMDYEVETDDHLTIYIH